jgi:hypothetical protein
MKNQKRSKNMPKTPKNISKPEPEGHIDDSSKFQGTLKAFGGSMSDDWNDILATQTARTLWFSENESAEEIRRRQYATFDVLFGIKPQDEIEGMIAAQLVACHNASMECYRRAMHREQTFEGRKENLSQANKLSRTYATLVESLNRHRGKGQQKVTVEHVHVYDGGQAIVGNVEGRGGGFAAKTEEQPHAIAYAPGATMRSADAPREPVPVASNAERPLPDARRNVAGRPEGK